MGYFRLLLAFFVVAQHLAGAKFLGSSAVQAFFIVSGFLMTSVMSKTYGYSAAGFSKFWLNRVLRLYPAYLLIILMTVTVLLSFGETFTRSVAPTIGWPSDLFEWAQNVTMLFANPVPISVTPRLSPPTWALTLELVCYFLISIGLTRTRTITWIWITLGSIFLIWALFFSHNARLWGYGSIPSAFLPFALGGLLFHYQASIMDGNAINGSPRLLQKISGQPALRLLILSLIAIVFLVGVRTVVWKLTSSHIASMIVYVSSMVPAFFAVIAALQWKSENPHLKRFDKLAGDLFYPVYLCHWGIAVAVSGCFQQILGDTLYRGPLLFVLSSAVIVLFSMAVVFAIDRPINRLRDRVRPGNGSIVEKQ